MSAVCHVVCAGDFALSRFHPEKTDFVIACDAGLAHLERIGYVPDLVVGDFDSYEGAAPSGEKVVVLPREKDDTDSAYALKAGLARGFKRFILHGSLGGARLSHTLSNISLLSFLKEKGAAGLLLSEKTAVFLLEDEELRLPAKQTGYVSVFALTDACRVGLSGLKFTFEGALSPSFPLGCSNEFIGVPSLFRVGKGGALIVIEGDLPDAEVCFSARKTAASRSAFR